LSALCGVLCILKAAIHSITSSKCTKGNVKF
jgi:hypothetical protein